MVFEGATIGSRYELGKQIGGGGMGQVHFARDIHMLIGRQIAVKIIPCPNNPLQDEQVIELFRREVQAITKLSHPHILPLFDYGIDPRYTAKLAYLVMPFCQEGSLDDWYKGHSLSPQDVAHFIYQAASALQCAHDNNITHKDVKPQNFLIRQNIENSKLPDLILTDFGIAKLTTEIMSIGNLPNGTPAYMPPEQWNGRTTFATDQYALGIMAYELLTEGQRPFKGSMVELKEMHSKKRAEPPSKYAPGIPAALDDVILRALQKNPKDRYSSISKFAEAFQRAARSDEKGADIHLILAMSESEALVGATYTISLPQRQPVSITVPAGTLSGQELRLEGQGELPRFGGPAGALIASIVTKPDVSEEQIIIQQLQGLTQKVEMLQSDTSKRHQSSYRQLQVLADQVDELQTDTKSLPEVAAATKYIKNAVSLRLGMKLARIVLIFTLPVMIIALLIEFMETVIGCTVLSEPGYCPLSPVQILRLTAPYQGLFSTIAFLIPGLLALIIAASGHLTDEDVRKAEERKKKREEASRVRIEKRKQELYTFQRRLVWLFLKRKK